MEARIKQGKLNITSDQQRITWCKRLRFASSKFGFTELLLHQVRYTQLVVIKFRRLWKWEYLINF